MLIASDDEEYLSFARESREADSIFLETRVSGWSHHEDVSIFREGEDYGTLRVIRLRLVHTALAVFVYSGSYSGLAISQIESYQEFPSKLIRFEKVARVVTVDY